LVKLPKIFEKLVNPKNQGFIFWPKKNVALVVEMLEQLPVVTIFSEFQSHIIAAPMEGGWSHTCVGGNSEEGVCGCCSER